MQAYLTLIRRELGSHFYSWTGYIVIACVVFLLGFSFNALVTVLNSEPTDRPVIEMFFNTYYFWVIISIAAPIITMRSFAQEKNSGTFETLMTAPVSDWQVVLAKFTAAMVFYVLMWLPLLACLLIIHYHSAAGMQLDPETVATTFLGIVLLGCLYNSLGCLSSALTKSQIIAAIVSLAGSVALFVVSFIAMAFSTQSGFTSQFFTHLGLVDHMKDFARGVVDTRPLVLYLSLTALFLFLTHKAVESRRWK
jgi:ABC-2 type transport system permease protein